MFPVLLHEASSMETTATVGGVDSMQERRVSVHVY